MKTKYRFPLLLICVGALIAGGAPTSSGTGNADSTCTDSVTVDGMKYAVPSPWCGHAVDSSDWAKPSGLKRLPERLCYQGYDIYVASRAAAAFVNMADSAATDSVGLMVQSGYRSPGYQRKIIVRRMKDGKSFDEIARYVAPPGYSEHHTGRAMDLVCGDSVKTAFAGSNCYPWLKEHASRFGFYETYPKDSPDSIPWEPWHWTYQPDSLKK